uniref:Mothers against decapentaplegic homolog n=1 Tax=Onchocerca volvulus TaxID=6282 RepID=A0A8R1XZA5_ONCVO
MPLDCEIWCFLTERRRLIERLWRLRTIQSIDEKRSKRRFIRLLHAFDTEDLAAILKAVESGGRDIKQCAPGPPMDVMEEETPGCSRDAAESPNNDEGFLDQRYENTGLIPQIDKPMSLPYLCCKLWRWKELQVDAALHRLDPLPWCRFGRVTMNNATVSCCNPYHYALWIIANPETSPEDDSLSGGPNGGVSMIDHSFVTNDTGFGDEITGTSVANNILSPSRLPPLVSDSPVRNNQSHPSAWAHLYRWKEKERMDDRGVTLTGQFVAVGLLAHTVHDGQNVCIQWDIDNEASFALIRQLDVDETYEVWLYNSGDKPLFISIASSLSLHKSETIRRVSNGYCYRVHRGTNNALLQANTESHFAKHDPANTLSFLNISVGKGWGEKYHRINHTDTPCRYEVIFMPDNP